jgi:hypothetical protein
MQDASERVVDWMKKLPPDSDKCETLLRWFFRVQKQLRSDTGFSDTRLVSTLGLCVVVWWVNCKTEAEERNLYAQVFELSQVLNLFEQCEALQKRIPSERVSAQRELRSQIGAKGAEATKAKKHELEPLAMRMIKRRLKEKGGAYGSFDNLSAFFDEVHESMVAEICKGLETADPKKAYMKAKRIAPKGRTLNIWFGDEVKRKRRRPVKNKRQSA